MIEETIEKLKILQDILSEKFAVENEIDELPKALATKQELVNRLKKSFVEKNETFEETRRRVAEVRIRMQEAESDREKYESQMDRISTAREYDALDKEIREASDREQQYRRDLQNEQKDLDDQQTRLEREEALIRAQEEELEEERAKIATETKNKEAKLEELRKREGDTIPGLDEELLYKFERIIRSKAGEGIVAIRNGVCTGCQMILPNQFVNDVRSAEHIHFCPYCSKIVFFADTPEEEGAGFAESDAEGLSDLVGDDFVDDLLDDEELEGMDELLGDDYDGDDVESDGVAAAAVESDEDEEADDDDEDEDEDAADDHADLLEGDDEGDAFDDEDTDEEETDEEDEGDE